jgi:FKBP-type peptidyl-prolyl cis-trans isomerase FkpA
MILRNLIPVLCVAALMAPACGGSPTSESQTANVPFSSTDLSVGTGRVAATGNRVTANYTGWLYSTSAADNRGAQFDTSFGRGPFGFTLGAGQVIRGWDQGIVGMAVGGRRRLIIPPSLAYGSQGAPPSIPPNATIMFDIELVSVD